MFGGIDPIILFFGFGIAAGVLKQDVALPRSINELLTFLLLFTIGLKGGVELAEVDGWRVLPQLLVVACLGVVLPLVAYPVAKRIGKLGRTNSAALAAHYGSVSVGTFAVCIAYLQRADIGFEPHVVTFAVVLEIPAIIVGLLLARGAARNLEIGVVVQEVAKSRAIALLVGGLVIGRLAGHAQLEPFLPFFFDLFSGVLALFLLDMGLTVSKQLRVVRENGLFLVLFGLLMPVFGGALGLTLGTAIGLSLGGSVVLAVLGASSSYIAVPAAMRASLPEADVGLCLASSLGVTFPFNIMIGIPLLFAAAKLIC